MEDFKNTIECKIALVFVNTLVKGEYLKSYQMLSSELQHELSDSKIKEEYETMINYIDSKGESIDVLEILDDWKNKQEKDIAWVYVALCFDGESEAVAVTVAKEFDKYVISDIEWGRP